MFYWEKPTSKLKCQYLPYKPIKSCGQGMVEIQRKDNEDFVRKRRVLVE